MGSDPLDLPSDSEHVLSLLCDPGFFELLALLLELLSDHSHVRQRDRVTDHSTAVREIDSEGVRGYWAAFVSDPAEDVALRLQLVESVELGFFNDSFEIVDHQLCQFRRGIWRRREWWVLERPESPGRCWWPGAKHGARTTRRWYGAALPIA